MSSTTYYFPPLFLIFLAFFVPTFSYAQYDELDKLDQKIDDLMRKNNELNSRVIALEDKNAETERQKRKLAFELGKERDINKKISDEMSDIKIKLEQALQEDWMGEIQNNLLKMKVERLEKKLSENILKLEEDKVLINFKIRNLLTEIDLLKLELKKSNEALIDLREWVKKRLTPNFTLKITPTYGYVFNQNWGFLDKLNVDRAGLLDNVIYKDIHVKNLYDTDFYSCVQQIHEYKENDTTIIANFSLFGGDNKSKYQQIFFNLDYSVFSFLSIGVEAGFGGNYAHSSITTRKYASSDSTIIVDIYKQSVSNKLINSFGIQTSLDIADLMGIKKLSVITSIGTGYPYKYSAGLELGYKFQRVGVALRGTYYNWIDQDILYKPSQNVFYQKSFLWNQQHRIYAGLSFRIMLN